MKRGSKNFSRRVVKLESAGELTLLCSFNMFDSIGQHEAGCTACAAGKALRDSGHDFRASAKETP